MTTGKTIALTRWTFVGKVMSLLFNISRFFFPTWTRRWPISKESRYQIHRCYSLAESCPTLCNSMEQHTRLPCPSLSPRVCSNSRPLSRWCHPTISSSVTPFSSCPQSFQALGSFLISWLFTLGGQSIGVSASVSVLSMNIQGWFPLGLTDLISLQSKELWSIFCSTTVWKYQFFSAQPSLGSNCHIHDLVLDLVV